MVLSPCSDSVLSDSIPIDSVESNPYYFYRHRLPHFDPKDAPYFVTYRLHGSVPKSEAKRLLELWRTAKTEKEKADHFREYEQVLHRNGPYHLAEERIRNIVMESLANLNGRAIYIHAYSIMPNHVHAVFDCLDSRPLFRIMQEHKKYTALRINRMLKQRGHFWKAETYDHVVREGRLGNAVWYVLMNPVKAGLVTEWRKWPGTYLSPDYYGFEEPA